jgi:hypothetical protein
MISNVCSVRIVLAIIATYIIGLSSARQISDKILADHEAEIRLGYSGEASDFKRLVHPKDEYGYQLKSLLFPLKAQIPAKRSKRSNAIQLCGRQLHQMLAVLCNTRTGAGRRKRSAQETDEAVDEFYTTMYRPYEDIDYNMPLTYEDGLSPSEVLLDRIFGESLQGEPEQELRSKRKKRRTNGASACCQSACTLAQLRSYCPSRRS